jgi:hypothetical protein
VVPAWSRNSSSHGQRFMLPAGGLMLALTVRGLLTFHAGAVHGPDDGLGMQRRVKRVKRQPPEL